MVPRRVDASALLQQAACTDPHPFTELIGGTGNDWDDPQTTKRQLHSSGYAGRMSERLELRGRSVLEEGEDGDDSAMDGRC